MKCKHDKSRICGAGWRNSVFKLVKVERKYQAIYGETEHGCFKDARKRDIPNRIKAGYGNPKKCFKLAMDAGY
jgi:hypothetical protein